MARVYERKREMVDGIVKVHLDRYQAMGDELIFGEGGFVDLALFVSPCEMARSAPSLPTMCFSTWGLMQPFLTRRAAPSGAPDPR